MKKTSKKENILIECIKKILGNKKNNKKINFVDALDSIQMMEFIILLEKKNKIKFKPEEINKEVFSSYKNILNLIATKKERVGK
jgi:acyl carrier protein|tara:strand:+ start:170 stop:421 length:252 start_codon:yes stop_codon:yes gene_type:complete